MTIRATGWCGTTVVWWAIIAPTPDRLKATPATVRTTPATVVTGWPGMFSGTSQWCSASVPASGPMNSSGGKGNRTAAPLVGVEVVTGHRPRAAVRAFARVR